MTCAFVRRTAPSTLMVRNDISGEVVTIMTSTTRVTTLPTPAVHVSRRCRVVTVKRRYSVLSAFFLARVAARADRAADFAAEGLRADFGSGAAGLADAGPKPLGLLGVAIHLSHSSEEPGHDLIQITRTHGHDDVARLGSRHGELHRFVPVRFKVV